MPDYIVAVTGPMGRFTVVFTAGSLAECDAWIDQQHTGGDKRPSLTSYSVYQLIPTYKE